MKITEIPGISPARAKALKQAGIHTPLELIRFFPRGYLDRRSITPIGHLRGIGETVTVTGRIRTTGESGFKNNRRFEAVLQDGTGQLKGVWFKGLSYFKNTLKKDEQYAFFGRVKRYGRFLSMAHPEVEQLSCTEPGDSSEPGGSKAPADSGSPRSRMLPGSSGSPLGIKETGSPDASTSSELQSPGTKGRNLQHSDITGIIPVYPGNQFFKKTWITSALLRKWILFSLDHIELPEFLPPDLRNKLGYSERHTAYRHIHAPDSPQEHKKALERFKFEELFLFEMGVVTLKKEVLEKTPGPIMARTKPLTSRFFNKTLDFQLTDGQIKSLGDIKKNIRSGYQMNRLLQGDVGSGKTIVAIGAMLMALDSGYQSVMMAPTEILAEQHYQTLIEWLRPLGVNIRILTGNQKKSLREDIVTDIASGSAHIVLGTHAIIQESVRFHRLGMAIIDEQHRFGVSQRALLRDKGINPHILVMSATPIPRSLAMTLYSDLDVSVIRGLPPGRKEVITRILRESDRIEMHRFLKEQLQDGGQVYIVYPLIEESEAMDLKNATEGYDQIRTDFPGVSCGLLHGRMGSGEKEQVMQKFKENRIKILVSTTVIEVGVNVPNASVMVIEHAERFGLSQLHQLRGRIGRGSRQSFCLLMADFKQSREARTRLKTMKETNDGFKIAEADLKLRGPGDFLGTRQSGLPEFQYADILNDQYLLEIAKEMAINILESDPGLNEARYASLKDTLLPYLEEKKKFFRMS